MTRITELAQIVDSNTKVVNDYLERNGLPTPSFEADGPVDLGISKDPEVEKARVRAVEASLELHELLEGPRMQLRPKINGLALQAIYHYRIPQHIPLTGPPIPIPTLSTLTGLPAPQLRQLLRYAISIHHVFSEPTPNHIAHSAASRLLATDAGAMDMLGFMFDENYSSFALTLAAWQKFDGSTEPQYTGFSLALNTDQGRWGYYDSHPELAKRFANAMGAAGTNFERTILAREVKWSELRTEKGGKDVVVVDVGGSKGHVSVGIARMLPEARFVVQDLEQALQGAEEAVPEEVRGRVEFQRYDFFTEQVVRGADVYLLSHILHNWSDENVLRILRALVPALRRGARVLVNDAILPEPGKLGWLQERDLRYIDLAMWSMFNSRERERNDWVELFSEADKRFGNIKFHTGASAWGVIEIEWLG